MRRIKYTQEDVTKHKCFNCAYPLSIMTSTTILEEGETVEGAKNDNDNVKEEIVNTTFEEDLTQRFEKGEITKEEAMKEFHDPTRFGGSLSFYCKNCRAEFFYESDLILNLEDWKDLTPDATEEEIKEYEEFLKTAEIEAYPLYQFDKHSYSENITLPKEKALS